MAESGHFSYLEFRGYIEANDLKSLDEFYYNNRCCSFENESCHMMYTMCCIGTSEDIKFLLQHSIPRKDLDFVSKTFSVGKIENGELLLKNGFVFNINRLNDKMITIRTAKYLLKEGLLSFEKLLP